jgi:hypothetical protein
VAAAFTYTHCNAVPEEQVVDGKPTVALVRHALLAQTRPRWPGRVR